MRGPNLLGWGPLAPGEYWTGSGTPSLYLKHSSTFARYPVSPDLREIDPTGFTETPKDPLAAAKFLDALPSPRVSMERLEFVRTPDRAGVIRLSASTPPPPPQVERPRPPEPARSQPLTQAPQPAPVIARRIEQMVEQAPESILETYYSAPIWTGIVIMNPPEKKPAKRPGKQGMRDDGLPGW